jgi:ribosomal protein S18 acetylase RimI-like enzyme
MRFWKEQYATGCPHLVAFRTDLPRDSRAIVGYVATMPCHDSPDVPSQIYSIAVCPKHRRRGIASLLLEALVAASPPGRRISLNARVDNPAALALYGKHGFVEQKRLAAYYADGGDGVLMVC